MKLLTWNISLTNPSFSAPDDWDPSLNVFEIHRVMEDEDPDIFLLQEMPKANFAKRFVDYDFTPPVTSHSGWLSSFVRKGVKLTNFYAKEYTSTVEVTTNEGSFFLISCHLVPYKQNASLRLSQLQNIVSDLPADATLIIAGDMNMREDETKSVLEVLSVEDAFQLVGSKEDKFTWNSRVNKYANTGFEYTARYDRVFVRGFGVKAFGLIGDKPVSENTGHFISDHYGITVELELSAN